MKNIFLFILFNLSYVVYGQKNHVFTKDWLKDEIEGELNSEIVVVDSSNFQDIPFVNRVVFAYQEYDDFDILRMRPKFCSTVKEIYSFCVLPPDIALFKNVRSIKCETEVEFCGSQDHYLTFMRRNVSSLKKLKHVSFNSQSNSNFQLFERLGALNKMKDFDVRCAYYPFSILTNGSIKKIAYSNSYPEMELFRQLGFSSGDYDNLIEEKIKNGKLPLTPKENLIKTKLTNGVLELFYLNGQKLVEGIVKSGEIDGAWKLWYSNGTICETRNYKNGIPNGSWCFYEEDGDTTYNLEYKNGDLEVVTHIYKDSGIYLKTVTKDYQNFSKRAIIHHLSRIDDGIKTVKNSHLIGDSLIYLEKQLSKNGIPQRLTKFNYYLTDQYQLFESTDFYENGNKRSFLEYIVEAKSGNEVPHGTKVTWNENGILIKKEFYTYGELIN